jgi:hypothetical protein
MSEYFSSLWGIVFCGRILEYYVANTQSTPQGTKETWGNEAGSFQTIRSKQTPITEVDMIASLTDFSRKKEEQKNYDQLVGFLCEKITHTSTWMLILSITNNAERIIFSNKEAGEMVHMLCTEFGIRTSAIQYFRTFSSVPAMPKTSKGSNVIHVAFKKDYHKTNNERLIHELRSAVLDKSIEYQQALGLVFKIIDSYPDTEKHLQG